MLDADPLNPQRVFWELNDFLPDRAIVTADSGSGTNWWARQLRLRRGMRAALSGTLATMGPSMPYAVAAKFAYPDRPVIAVEGDGSMQMNGINSLIDAARYYPRWSDPRLVLLVLHNNDLNQVTWEQRVLAGDPKLEASQDLPDFPYAEYARMLGLDGVRVDEPEQIRPAWERAMAADRPFVFEAITDPNVPPMPPHIRYEQAKEMGMAMLHGDPDRVAIAKQAAKAKLPGVRQPMSGAATLVDTAVGAIDVAVYRVPAERARIRRHPAPGARPRSSSSRRVAAASAGSATRTAPPRSPSIVARRARAGSYAGADALAPQAAWAAMSRAVRNSRAGRSVRVRDLGGRHRAARPQGAPARASRSPTCSAAGTTASSSTARAASPPTRSTELRGRRRAGWRSAPGA